MGEHYWTSQAEQRDIGFLFGLDGALGVRTRVGLGNWSGMRQGAAGRYKERRLGRDEEDQGKGGVEEMICSMENRN